MKYGIRYCNLGIFLDYASSIMNLELPIIAELLVRYPLTALLDLPTLWDQLVSYLDSTGEKNYYEAGVVVGKIIKIIFDLNINNT